MNADDILFAIRKYYGTRKEPYAIFPEFKTQRGYGTNRYIDAVVFGLWKMNLKIIAFEIKVSKSDFNKDAKQFHNKHKHALDFCHEFYYICPFNLIDKSEVPDRAGLVYVNDNKELKFQKVSPVQEIDSVPIRYVQALAFRKQDTVEFSGVPLKYLGKKILPKDFTELLKKTKVDDAIRDAEEEFREKTKKMEKKQHIIGEIFRNVLEIAGFSRWYTGQNLEKAEEIIKEFAEVANLVRKFKSNFSEMKKYINAIDEEIKKTPK